MSDEFYYFKINTSYPVGVRFNMQDTRGRVLTINDPYVQIKRSELRDFKRANYWAIDKGLILETAEPSMDIESPNMIDDAKIAEIVKNKLALKDALVQITAPHIFVKMLEEAKRQNRNQATIKQIEAKLKEFAPEENEDPDSPLLMKGVE
jgi:hypothetical protein